MRALGEPRPRRIEREQALRPRAQQEGVIGPVLALGEADRQPRRWSGTASRSACRTSALPRVSFARAGARIRQWTVRVASRRPAAVVVGRGRTRSSSLRELMPSLRKTLRRWYLTVRGLMNSRVPISGFDESVAGEARDQRLLGGELVAGLGRASANGLAGGQQLVPGPLGERFGSHRGEHFVGRPQAARARRPACGVAPQPLTVEQVAAGELHAHAGAAETLDRLAVAAVGGIALAEQGADAGFDPERPLGGRHTRTFGQPLEGGLDERYVTGSRTPPRASSGTSQWLRRPPDGAGRPREAASRAASWRPRPL